MARIIKEIIIMLLVCLVAMLGFAVFLYKYIPSKKIVPELKQYEATEQVQDLLADNIDSRADDEKVLLTYEVTKGELSGYQKSNDYIPGKSNPFADVPKTVTGEGEEGKEEENTQTPENPSDKKEETPKVTPSNPSIYEGSSTK